MLRFSSIETSPLKSCSQSRNSTSEKMLLGSRTSASVVVATLRVPPRLGVWAKAGRGSPAPSDQSAPAPPAAPAMWMNFRRLTRGAPSMGPEASLEPWELEFRFFGGMAFILPCGHRVAARGSQATRRWVSTARPARSRRERERAACGHRSVVDTAWECQTGGGRVVTSNRRAWRPEERPAPPGWALSSAPGASPLTRYPPGASASISDGREGRRAGCRRRRPATRRRSPSCHCRNVCGRYTTNGGNRIISATIAVIANTNGQITMSCSLTFPIAAAM